MGAAKGVSRLIGGTINKGIRAVTGNPKTPSAPTVRMAAAPAPAPAPAPVSAPLPAPTAKINSVPSISNPFGGGMVSTDSSGSSGRSTSGSFGLGNLPDTNISLTEPEAEREEDDSITVKSPGIAADDEEKRRDAVDKAKDYKIASETY